MWIVRAVRGQWILDWYGLERVRKRSLMGQDLEDEEAFGQDLRQMVEGRGAVSMVFSAWWEGGQWKVWPSCVCAEE